jgi:4-alpha-glucanotransferase
MSDVKQALKERIQSRKQRKVEPVIVVWDGRLRLPSNKYTLHLEDGEIWSAGRVPTGYHRLKMDTGQESLVISAPTKAFIPKEKRWGLFAPVYAAGRGNLRDFQSFTEWMGKFNGSVAATLPLLATFLSKPFEPSPYSPISRLFWNEFYIDAAVEAVIGASRLVDYRSEMEQKRAVLEEMARRFFAEPRNGHHLRFQEFLNRSQGVEDYARFRAVTDRLGKGWRAWPARLRDGNIRQGDYQEETKRYYLYTQWLIQDQLQSMADRAAARNQMLYLDLPLGLHPDGYDVWHDREIFVQGVTGGAPPDPVFTAGQNWGFPPMHPEAMRLQHHRYTIAYIRNHLRYAKLLRIDHVMGLHRLYWIPGELTWDKGVYVEYPAEDLYAILSLESHRNQAGIVGENLGTVPPEVNRSMSRHNIQEMYVLQYEIVADTRRATLRHVPENCVASLNTHDMPPFRAFLEGRDIEDRLKLGFLKPRDARQERKRRAELIAALVRFLCKKGFLEPEIQITKPESIFQAATAFLAASMANIVLVNVEDLWQEVLPQNVPATHKERPNWRRRFRYSLEEIQQMRTLVEELRNVSAQRSRSVPL